MNNTIEIGIIVKPQGVKGEMKVSPLTDNPKRFLKLEEVFIDGKEYKVESVRVSGNDVFVFLDGISDRDEVEKFRNKSIFVERSNAIKLEKDRYFIVDIVGCEVFLEDKSIGVVKDVLQYGSADIYVVKSKENSVMFPALKTMFLKVDIENKQIHLDKKTFEENAVYEN